MKNSSSSKEFQLKPAPAKASIGGVAPEAVIVPQELIEAKGLKADYSVQSAIDGLDEVEKKLQDFKLISKFSRLVSPVYFALEDFKIHIQLGEKYFINGDDAYAFRGGRYELAEIPEKPETVIHKTGRTLDLSSRGAARYSFFLLDSLPKLKLLEAAGLELADFDHVLINSGAPWLRDLIKHACGENCPELLFFNKLNPCFQFESSVHLEGVRSARFTPAWIYRYMDELFGKGGQTAPGESFGPRVYISRQKAVGRRIENHDGFMELLGRFGFREVFAEDYSPLELTRLMRDVELLISPHGAGLANMIFCPQSAMVVELFSSHFTQQYFNLARDRGQRYVAFACKDTEGLNVFDRYDEGTGARDLYNRADIVVPLDELEALLQRNLS